MAIGIGELITAIGDENIEFQNLDQCTEDLKMSGGVTKIRFGTHQQAFAEAHRLAKKYVGHEFFVVQAVSGPIAEAARSTLGGGEG